MTPADGAADPPDPSTTEASPDIGGEEGSPEPAGGDPVTADPATVDEHGSAGTVEDLLETLETTTAERDDYLDRWQRVSAEFANFKKQTEKRNADFAAQAGARVAEALLPVLDACDAAAQQGVEGVDPIAAQLRAELERAGLEVIATADEPFDPTRHEAAMSEPGDDGQEAPVVAQVLRTGYAWNGRVLRAAMVKVRG